MQMPAPSLPRDMSTAALAAAKGQTAVVSGGSRGLGATVVRRLLRQGWNVATFSRSGPPDVAASDIGVDAGELDERLFWHPADMASADQLREFATLSIERFGRIDLLVNNAGMLVEGLLAMTGESDIERLIAVNLTGPILLTKACVKAMMRHRRGAVINISSINSVRGHQGVSIYTASKAGLDGFTRSMARELGPLNIRVNSIVPGFFATDLVASLNESRRDRIARRTPLHRLSDVEQVADAVMFLASDASAFITGQTLIVDGGYTC
ncbi:3-oxoacyl-[acyl-carrier protein] reductase [Breoghania corrubedonensis]|uniref:3-oxoacyl-[acyl-carrier protein] reductase n=1 Tax=Breoghania corrubedonensis TaxID=665038 RepID=A0A2T5VE95_9HYPH|nr:glucose 1-dehydrogenase [Breoghania corrubedonensis]PTW62036.1 3-oxoacyl-[acyl-carrier protein] reductase [Breoghania corrubedonensis]